MKNPLSGLPKKTSRTRQGALSLADQLYIANERAARREYGFPEEMPDAEFAAIIFRRIERDARREYGVPEDMPSSEFATRLAEMNDRSARERE
jgi:hypothetical protein